eukprot:jgi/Chlat1/5124/Chrsp33S05121
MAMDHLTEAGQATSTGCNAADDEQYAKDCLLVSLLAANHKRVFAADYQLFPSDVMKCAAAAPGIELAAIESQLEEYCSEARKLELQLQCLRKEEAENQSCESSSSYIKDVADQLRSFLQALSSFQTVYTQADYLRQSREIRAWTHNVTPPELHGVGPSASRVLNMHSRFKQLQKSFGNVRIAYEQLSSPAVLHVEGVQMQAVELAAHNESNVLDIERSLTLLL